MAGDWIKMRMDLQTHPKVVRILSATGSDKFRVIGGLHAVWSVFDQHSEDGVLPGYTPEVLDHIIGWEGFADAMIAVGWLECHDGESLSMPGFAEHNGKSAKRRAEDQKRKKDVRKTSAKRPQNDETNSGPEKRREEKKENPPVVPPSGGRENSKRGHRLPNDWELPGEWRDWAAENTPNIDPDWEASKFRDYWQAKAGSQAAKVDWKKTWQNWCRTAEERAGRGSRGDPNDLELAV